MHTTENTANKPNARYCSLIRVDVESEFIPEQSDPSQQRFVFAYHITVNNLGTQPCQLLSRHWIITDGNQKAQDVRGDGVIGEQPVIAPGDNFCYTSGAVLETPVGSMRGSYTMQMNDGEKVLAEIPVFTLASPNALH